MQVDPKVQLLRAENSYFRSQVSAIPTSQSPLVDVMRLTNMDLNCTLLWDCHDEGTDSCSQVMWVAIFSTA